MHARRFIAGIFVLLLAGAANGQAQRERIEADDVGQIYADAQLARAYEAFIAEHGTTVVPRTTQLLPVAADTFGIWLRALNPQLEAARSVESPRSDPFENWIVIPPDSLQEASTEFGEAAWAYLGNNYFTTLDTVSTSAIRARMERQFGPPTKTLAEQAFSDGLPTEMMQFEYWMVVNDSIRVMFMDTGGPFDRGVLVAGDHRYRDELYRLRQTLLGTIMTNVAPAPYVDYYYNSVTELWYRTGFNGQNYFLREIRRPDLARGRPDLAQTDQ